MKKSIYRFIFIRLLGWKMLGSIDANIKKCVIIVIPHTSSLDFFIALLVRGILEIPINFVGKKELFVFPFGYYFSSVGGVPLDRSGNKNTVDATAELFNERDVFRLALSPEGTRKKVTELKTGFYYIAVKANVSIIPVAFDFGRKQVKVGNLFYPTGNYTEDMEKIVPHFIGTVGKIPENSFEFIPNASLI
jgi:1-acyl-sn-glycerol-3-phosphate acyltransferase